MYTSHFFSEKVTAEPEEETPMETDEQEEKTENIVPKIQLEEEIVESPSKKAKLDLENDAENVEKAQTKAETEIETNTAGENEKHHDESFESCNGLKNYKKNERLSILIRKHQARKIIRFQCRQCFKWFPSKKRRNKHITMLHNRDVTAGKFLMRPLRWWAESAPPSWDRVRVSENLGATAVAPVAPADTSLHIPSLVKECFVMSHNIGHYGCHSPRFK